MEDLEKRLDLLEKTNSTPKNQPGVLSFSAALTGKSTQQIKQRNQFINVIAQDNRDRLLRENNVIVSGLPISDDDKTRVNQLFKAIGLNNITVNKVRRFQPSKNNPDAPGLLQVSLNPVDKTSVLKAGYHHKSQDHVGVYIREDRTPAQQSEFNELNEIKKLRNEKLNTCGLLDNPFRNIVHRRSGTVRCIDVHKSAEQSKCVFSSPNAAQLKPKQPTPEAEQSALAAPSPSE